MGSENAKVRVGIYIEKAILEQADGLLETANVRSRNEFVAEALKSVSYTHLTLPTIA